MSAHSKKIYRKNRLLVLWKDTLSHWLGWILVTLSLFYGMHRYFEYRDQQLDKRLEQLRSF